MTPRDLARAVIVAITVLGAIQVSDPATLGITPEFKSWCGILATALGALAGFLPRVQGTDRAVPPDDEFTAEEIAWFRQARDEARGGRGS